MNGPIEISVIARDKRKGLTLLPPVETPDKASATCATIMLKIT